MGCYTVPAAAAIIHFFTRKNNPRLRKSKHHLWLNQLFLGGAIFGVVDHWWNGELLAFSLRDLLLGAVITLVTFAVWGYLVLYDNVTHKSIVES
jgi:uncharacterized membrane protein YoaK (UPF0700 family)